MTAAMLECVRAGVPLSAAQSRTDAGATVTLTFTGVLIAADGEGQYLADAATGTATVSGTGRNDGN